MRCGYCGRVSHRCACGAPDSDLARFLTRGGRDFVPEQVQRAPKLAAPPQVKRRERATLKKHYRKWYRLLVEEQRECCGNCGSAENLVLDHIIPIAKGGRSALDNLQLLCAECNRIKGKLIIDCRSFRHRE